MADTDIEIAEGGQRPTPILVGGNGSPLLFHDNSGELLLTVKPNEKVYKALSKWLQEVLGPTLSQAQSGHMRWRQKAMNLDIHITENLIPQIETLQAVIQQGRVPSPEDLTDPKRKPPGKKLNSGKNGKE